MSVHAYIPPTWKKIRKEKKSKLNIFCLQKNIAKYFFITFFMTLDKK